VRIVVDLPAPLGPRKPVTRPVATVKETSSTATLSPYFLVRPETVIMAARPGAGSVESWRGACLRGGGRHIGERPERTLNLPLPEGPTPVGVLARLRRCGRGPGGAAGAAAGRRTALPG